MENKYGIVGIAHVGLPTNDLQKTVEFYKSLGFEVIMQSYNEKAGEKVAFLQIKNYCIETFENRQAAMSDGAYQHVALDVEEFYICGRECLLLHNLFDVHHYSFYHRGSLFSTSIPQAE